MKNELLDQAACFNWNQATARYEIEVMGHIVASMVTIREVKAFSKMHNDGLALALPEIARAKPPTPLKNSVHTYRTAGLEAHWGTTRLGAPVIFVRNPLSALDHQRTHWWMVTKSMFDAMNKVGIVEGFDRETLLADVFSIPA